MRKRIIIAAAVLTLVVVAAVVGLYLLGILGLVLGVVGILVALFAASQVYYETFAKNALWEANIHKRSGQDFRGRFKQ